MTTRATALLLAAFAFVGGAGRVVASTPLPDVELLDQDGQVVRLYSDLFEGKVVIAQAFFSTCATTCPRVTRKLVAVQRKLGERFGRDVFMVSLTVDPTVDTPERLEKFANRFHGRTGWRLVTGTPEAMDAALQRLGFLTAGRESHTTMVLIADEARGTWRKADGLGPPAEVLRVVDEVLAGRAADAP